VTPAPVVAKSATGAIPGSSPKTAGKPVPGAKPATGAIPAVAKATLPAAAAVSTPPAAKTPAAKEPAPASVPAAPAAKTPTPAAPAAKPPAPPARPAPPPVRPRTVAPARNATDEVTLPPQRPPAPRAAAGKAAAGGRRSLLLVIVGAVAIIVIAFVLITQVFGGSDSSSPAPQPNSVGPAVTATTTPDAAAGAVDRANTPVAVFNGTTGAGLARAAADKLQAAGFTKVGPVTTAPDQATATTTVYYDTGSKAAAVEVATTLGLSSTAVMAIDQKIKVLGQNAVVVVVLGADQAQ